MCGKNLSTDTVSTIGVQRAYNYALQPISRERFIGLVTADQPDTPPYFIYDAALNASERPTLEQALERELQPLSLERILALVNEGAQLLDTRDPAEFEEAHLHGAVNVGLGGSYATWCGTILDRQRPIVLVAEPEREAEAATRLGRIGFDNVAGYLTGGMQPLDHARELIDQTPRLAAPSLAEQLEGADPPLVIDVRSERDFRDQRIDQAINIPLSRLGERLATLAGERPLVVYCASGYRSAIAASLMRRERVRDVADLVGGIAAWEAARLPTAAP